MKELLISLGACHLAKEWASDKSWQEIYHTCHRGDWLLWLFARVNPEDTKLLTLAKAHCANSVRHLMVDERSIAAVDAAIAFGEGRLTSEELSIYADAAFYAATAAADAASYAYAAAADDAAAHPAADAARTASYAAGAAATAATDAYAAATAAADAYAAHAAAGAAYAAYAAAAKKKENQKLTAEICRKYLPIEIWNIGKKEIDA